MRRDYTDFSAPLPLGRYKAIQKAIELRGLGKHWSWTVIADAMEHYHGFKRCPSWYQKELSGLCEPRTRNPAWLERVNVEARRVA